MRGDRAIALALASLAAAVPALSMPGWSLRANSLLLNGDDGAPAVELPLRGLDDLGTTSRETLGGISPDARMAWTLDRRLIWSPGRARLLESRSLLRAFGSDGAELWRDEAVDLPERGAPVLFSADGEIVLLSKRSGEGFSAEARTWLGQVVATVGPFPRLISMALTPNGRYALARWGVPDTSDTHTFIDIATNARRDVPSSDLILGVARIGDDGAVRSGSKLVFAFAAASSASAGDAPAPSR